MKLFNQFNVLPRYLTAFNYAGLNLNETPKELEKCTPEFKNFWEKECIEVIKSEGLSYELGPNGTAIEGDWDKVFECVRKCHEKIHEKGAPRI